MGVYNFTTEYNSKNINLVYKINAEDKIDNVEHMMLTSNHIEGLLDVSYTSIDNLSYYKYNISSKITLARYLESEINKERLLKILMNIVNTLKNIEDYLILPKSLLFDKEYIYIDVSSMEVDFICLPVENTKKEIDLKFLIKDILYTAKFIDYENTAFISLILNYINTNNQIVVDEFNKLLVNEELSKSSDNSSSNTNAKVSVLADTQESTPKIRKLEVSEIYEEDTSKNKLSEKNKIIDKKLAKGQDNNKESKENKNNFFQDLISKGNNKKAEDKEKQENKNTKKQISIKQEKQKKSESDNNSDLGFSIPGVSDGIISETRKNNKREKITKNKKDDKQKETNKENKGFENKLESLFSKFKKDKTSDKPIKDIGENLFMPAVEEEDSIISTVADDTTNNLAENSNETILLGDNCDYKNTAYLIRTKDDEKIFITKELFKIGKEATYVDYVIRDNSTISRSHADILKIDDKYFIQDNNSKNHTYVNHELVSPNDKVQLNHNATITLSNEDFLFKLY